MPPHLYSSGTHCILSCMIITERGWMCVCVCALICAGYMCMLIQNFPPQSSNPSASTQTPARTHIRIHEATSEGPAPDRVSRSINYFSAPAIKQGYYQAAARRPGKARPIKGCCDVGAGVRSCDSNTEWQLMLSGD